MGRDYAQGEGLGAEVRVALTPELTTPTRRAARQLLMRAFHGHFSEHDWHHALGGTHALIWHRDIDNGDELVGHGALVERWLTCGGATLRAGYVEALAVRADCRGRGYASAIMAEFENLIRRHYDLGALSASDAAVGFYVGRDWRQWRGPTSVITPGEVTRTPDDDGGVYVLRARAELDLDAELSCEWRGGDVW